MANVPAGAATLGLLGLGLLATVVAGRKLQAA